MTLEQLVIRSAQRTPSALAVSGPDGTLSYAALDALANQLGRVLLLERIGPGERVGLWLDKGVRAVAAMQGALRVGAAYVPLDPGSPPARTASIVRDCQMRLVVTTAARAESLGALVGPEVRLLVVDATGERGERIGWDAVLAQSSAPLPPVNQPETALAYILYTSGSTGMPKGVCISHRNALAFVEWAVQTLDASAADVFSNHAPFNFDLSVLDLYAAFWVGARVAIVPEALAYAPRQLVEFAARERISIWYSVPSALILMSDQGGLLERDDLSFRVVLFAGEPFPIGQLRPLRERFARCRFLNLYGPTETNVCTAFEVHAIEPERTSPVPIGSAVCGDRVWIELSESAEPAQADVPEGELIVSGPTVMLGYWGQPPQGERPYRTGDIVRQLPDGGYAYVGRRDHLVKVRGRRIELGEIEAALLQHPGISSAAVVVVGSGLEAKLVAFLVGPTPLSLLQVKQHCAQHLPRYMIVDRIHALESLPRTANGKVDRRALTALAAEADVAPRREQG